MKMITIPFLTQLGNILVYAIEFADCVLLILMEFEQLVLDFRALDAPAVEAVQLGGAKENHETGDHGCQGRDFHNGRKQKRHGQTDYGVGKDDYKILKRFHGKSGISGAARGPCAG